jgi:predicted Zn finger-like uncharacterized protein
MEIVCPTCSAQGSIDGSNLPKEGRQVTCPRCRNRFRIWPERSAVEIIQQRTSTVCPKCHCEQPVSDRCTSCGIIFQKYLQAQAVRQDMERHDFTRLRDASRRTDNWYSDLFDRRLSTLLVRVLSLLLFSALCIAWSMNNARKNKVLTEQLTRAAEGPARPGIPERSDAVFRERYDAVNTTLSENTNRCFLQCYSYVFAWYQPVGPEHCLTPDMAQELVSITRKKSEVRTAYGQLPTPSPKYWDCYVKTKKLYNLYEDIYKITIDYRVRYNDLSGRLSGLNNEYYQLVEDINACKVAVK